MLSVVHGFESFFPLDITFNLYLAVIIRSGSKSKLCILLPLFALDQCDMLTGIVIIISTVK